MCGIAGEVRFDGADADLAALARCTARMTRCGPDSGGAWTSGPIGFGHRRLKIIDLSAARSQPMIDAQLGLSVVFNGCLYNYRTAARFCPRSRRSSPVTGTTGSLHFPIDEPLPRDLVDKLLTTRIKQLGLL
jgi:asparagine synthetase B (glutamine-hydrolysing)